MTMSRQEILKYVLRSRDLPTLPSVASKLITLSGQKDTTLADIADLISKDVALSAKILKISNSAFYAFPQKISSINKAAALLGTGAVCSLSLSFSFFSIGGSNTKTIFNFQEFWEKSLAGAVAARLILAQIPGANTGEIFTASLLCNIGKLVFACTVPELYNQFLSCLQKYDGKAEIALEEKIIGASHCDIGYAVAEHWRFPLSLLLPIKYHDTPEKYTGGDKQMALAINAVYLSTILVHILYSDNPEQWHSLFRSKAETLLKLETSIINKILGEVHKVVDQAAGYFGLHMPPTRSIEEILQEANIRLSLINLSYEELTRELARSKMKLKKNTRELEQKNKLLKNMANIDGLTEIYNHRYFQDFLGKEINRAIRNKEAISILMADIDHFKRLNDTYGHQTGDFILKEFGKVCKNAIREYDLMARYGGEEFVFVLPGAEPDDAKTIAEKIRTTVENHVFDDGNAICNVTISIGVASARPTDQNFKKYEFVDLADQALYQAKKEGKNKVVMSTPNKEKKWLDGWFFSRK